MQVKQKHQSTLDFKSCAEHLKIEEPKDKELLKEAVKSKLESSSPPNKDNDKEVLKESVK